MKRIKKNQAIIAVLTVLLGVAGYINFSGNDIELAGGDKEEYDEAFAGEEPDVSAGEISVGDMEAAEHIELNSDEDEIGEAVLTSAGAVGGNIVSIKLSREQERSKIKENYLSVINDDGMDEAAVSSATDAYVKLSDDMEKEAEAETILSAKGYGNCIVSISDDAVDVIVARDELSGEERAMIEDVVVRKTGCKVSDIVISTLQ